MNECSKDAVEEARAAWMSAYDYWNSVKRTFDGKCRALGADVLWRSMFSVRPDVEVPKDDLYWEVYGYYRELTCALHECIKLSDVYRGLELEVR